MNCFDVDQVLNVLFSEIRKRLDEPSRVAKAAEACAAAVGVGEGVTMEIEQPIYEAGRLHDAAVLLHRLP